MVIVPGSRLGPYEIAAKLGEGGMGEVYRATDTKLKRQVAIKILPEAVGSDPDRLARFRREAEVLASLNHPNIAHIYGLEGLEGRAGQDGTAAIVMELVEGPTLAEIIDGSGAHGAKPAASSQKRSRLPLHEALRIARQIADALEAAHERGIIHRDLKPANIKVRPDGTVKVLDFGLAKIAEPKGGAQADTALETAGYERTRHGVVLGTVPYMSPEQARGHAVDKRTDIWAFGCILYEMLVGRRAFEGGTASDTLAAILEREPDWTRLPQATPAAVSTLIARCLEKSPASRVGDIAVARFVLDNKDESVTGVTPAAGVSRRMHTPTLAAFAAGAVLATAAVWYVMRPAPAPSTRTTIASTAADALSIEGNLPDLSIAADGSKVVYRGAGGVIFARALDALEPASLTGGGSVRNPILSPDGQWVAFEGDGVTLKKVAITGGPPTTLTRLDGALRGVCWAADHTIIFTNGDSGLRRIADVGGTPEVLTRTDSAAGESGHYWPEVLPGGSLLFTIVAADRGEGSSRVVVRDLRTGAQHDVLRASHAHYFNGYLLYVAQGQLFAIAFDPGRWETRGKPVPVLPRLVTTSWGAGDFSVASNGTLVYVDGPAGAGSDRRSLVWVDRAGNEVAVPAPARAYGQLRLSPDGSRAAVYNNDEERDIWLWDFARTVLTRLTFDPAPDMYPVWTNDGRGMIFGSTREGGTFNLWQIEADGTGSPQRLTTRPRTVGPHAVTPDGRSLIIEEVWPGRGRDLMRLSLDASHEIMPVLQTSFEEVNGKVSPDGRWLAYQTDATGRFEIHVRPFPNADGGHWQVSFEGGRQPVWARGGQELDYLTASGAIMSVDVDVHSATWAASPPKKLFEGRYLVSGYFWSYDVSSDGARFLMLKEAAADSVGQLPRVVVVQYFDEELKRLMSRN